MRFGKDSDAVLVLDTPAECGVLQQYLEYSPMTIGTSHYNLQVNPPTVQELNALRNSVKTRFFNQAQEYPRTNFSLEMPILKAKPEFEVQTSDIPTLIEAADCYINQTSFLRRLIFKKDKKLQAAYQIREVLKSTK